MFTALGISFLLFQAILPQNHKNRNHYFQSHFEKKAFYTISKALAFFIFLRVTFKTEKGGKASKRPSRLSTKFAY